MYSVSIIHSNMFKQLVCVDGTTESSWEYYHNYYFYVFNCFYALSLIQMPSIQQPQFHMPMTNLNKMQMSNFRMFSQTPAKIKKNQIITKWRKIAYALNVPHHRWSEISIQSTRFFFKSSPKRWFPSFVCFACLNHSRLS